MPFGRSVRFLRHWSALSSCTALWEAYRDYEISAPVQQQQQQQQGAEGVVFEALVSCHGCRRAAALRHTIARA